MPRRRASGPQTLHVRFENMNNANWIISSFETNSIALDTNISVSSTLLAKWSCMIEHFSNNKKKPSERFTWNLIIHVRFDNIYVLFNNAVKNYDQSLNEETNIKKIVFVERHATLFPYPVCIPFAKYNNTFFNVKYSM